MNLAIMHMNYVEIASHSYGKKKYVLSQILFGISVAECGNSDAEINHRIYPANLKGVGFR